jgi:L-ascorbate metabolism protein UlaG (beta-lactamase superfamily)
MSHKQARIKYYGWSSLSIETDEGVLFFDPFYRRYCQAQWFSAEDFDRATVVCLTHGHEEHFLDAPEIIRRSGAIVVARKAVCDFLRWRNGIPKARLVPIEDFATREVPGFKITAFPWKHRDINLTKALTKALFHGNSTQLAWAFSSATRAPFYSAYTGFHVELPNGLTVLNYNEGFNSKMTDAEIEALGRRFRTDVLLGGMQLHFVDDVVRGAAALNPKVVVLYPPHEKFHEMMGAASAPWTTFVAAVKAKLPQARIVLAEPGTVVDAKTGTAAAFVPAGQASYATGP